MIIPCINQKGGSGKTTTAVTLATYLAKKGQKILLVDLDQQRNASRVIFEEYLTVPEDESVAVIIAEDPPALPYHKTRIPNLYITPSHRGELANASISLSGLMQRDYKLKNAISQIQSEFDHIIIDSPPDLSLVTINALVAADKVIITTEPSVDGVEGTVLVYQTIDVLRRKGLNPYLEILGVLLVQADSTNTTKKIKGQLEANYREKFFKVNISRNDDIRKAHNGGLSVYEFAPKCTAARQYSALIENEILPKLDYLL